MKFMMSVLLGLSLMSSVAHSKTCTLTVKTPGAEEKSVALSNLSSTRERLVLAAELENFKASYVSNIISKKESLSLSIEDNKAYTSTPMALLPALNLKLEKNGVTANLSCLDFE